MEMLGTIAGVIFCLGMLMFLGIVVAVTLGIPRDVGSWQVDRDSLWTERGLHALTRLPRPVRWGFVFLAPVLIVLLAISLGIEMLVRIIVGIVGYGRVRLGRPRV